MERKSAQNSVASGSSRIVTGEAPGRGLKQLDLLRRHQWTELRGETFDKVSGWQSSDPPGHAGGDFACRDRRFARMIAPPPNRSRSGFESH
jgi:hypothetical protein